MKEQPAASIRRSPLQEMQAAQLERAAAANERDEHWEAISAMRAAKKPDAALTPEEYNLVRQAVLNQDDEERRQLEAILCRQCRARRRDEISSRRRLRAAALKKLQPQEAA
jgi:hypothetical protein